MKKSAIETLLEKSLKESANMMYELAYKHCHNGIMDENCVWYHSMWQYLRMLDVVSSPTWHHDFYLRQLSMAIKDKENNNILISGTADYSVLAYIIYCIKSKKAQANIYVLDTCRTPLEACKWFANKEGIEINLINENILSYSQDNFFDVICTDAFLTRFSNTDANLVIDKWYHLLKNDGKVITTIRIHEKTTDNNSNKIDAFLDKIKNKYDYYKDSISLTYDELIEKARFYATNMKSNNIGNENKIIKKFAKYNVDYQVKIVVGELSETKYIELVATKK